MQFRTTFRFPSVLLTLSLLVAILFGACSSGGKTSADETASRGVSDDQPLDPLPDKSSKQSTEPGSPAGSNPTNWVSIGATVVDGEAVTYNPPPSTMFNVVPTQPDGTVQWDEVVMPMIADAAVTTPKIADGAVTNAKIADHAVTSPRINVGQVMTVDITDLAVTTVKFDDAAVTTARIADNAVTSPRIVENPIMTTDIADAAVTTPKIVDLATDVLDSRVIMSESILPADVATGAVTTTEILNETILREDIQGDAVGAEEIVNESILSDSVMAGGKEQKEPLDQITPDAQQIPEPKPIVENAFRACAGSPYSTFSIDVDNASYSNVRGYLSRGTLPPADAVRIEELINYFDYDYPDPAGEHPFDFHSEVVECPWNADHLIVRLALQGKRLQPEQAAACNLVFLIDVSGSMSDANKLDLLKQSFLKLVDRLRPQDRVAIVVYAGAAGLVLESTPGSDKEKIRAAIRRLQSGGSTAGGAGIRLAYKVARDNYLSTGINRVILATDGDFNVGVSSQQGLVSLIEEERKDGVFLSVLGFGTGNYQDAKMEQLADNGNGNYYYIDRIEEGERVLADEMSGTLFAIAKDVKLQIRFNPSKVAAYRLIGYENRVLAAKDFDDDRKDAGELGAGHRVTALYEVVPVGADVGFEVDTTQGEDYQLDEKRPELLSSHDLLLARLRYKEPADSVSNLIEHIVRDERKEPEAASEGTRFAMAVAGWGMLLRGSRYAGTGSFDGVLTLAKGATGFDPGGYRKEFIGLVEKSRGLTGVRGAVGEH